jgi:hypothetical protein
VLGLLAFVLCADALVPAARAEEVLFAGAAAPECGGEVRCLIAARYAPWPAARALALALVDELGDVAGSEVEHDMDGGYRGAIHIVPALPVGAAQVHLERVLRAQRDFAAFFAALERHTGRALPYRHQGLVWRFFRSVGRRTPSAYAQGWEIAYNLDGSLNGATTSVRDTLFHEIFHLNDFAHGGWSRRALGEMVDGIRARCGARVACFTPFAPTPTRVRATGLYYAFQDDNGDTANEYAAELATRWFHEQRAALDGTAWPAGRFKCGPAENARAWRALGAEFFGGVDLVPDCRAR